MGAIVKADSNLSNGGIAVLRRSFTTNRDSTFTYNAEYCCLAEFASRWAGYFRPGAAPPTSVPTEVLTQQLVGSPTLFDVTSETNNGLTYFRASYSAVVESTGTSQSNNEDGLPDDVTITETSDIRSISWPVTYPTGYTVTVPFSTTGATSFVTTGTETMTHSFDYVSVSVTVTAKNGEPGGARGYTGAKFNIIGDDSVATSSTIETFTRTRNSRGESTYSVTSTGIYVADAVSKAYSRNKYALA